MANLDSSSININLEQSGRIEPILFGAEISYRHTENHDWFVYSDGFIDTTLKAVNFTHAIKKLPVFGKSACKQHQSTNRTPFEEIYPVFWPENWIFPSKKIV